MEWISVEDRLPEDGQEVLGTQYNYLDESKGRYISVVKLLNDKWFEWEGIEEVYAPTHWMPLPEPPK